MSDRLLTFIESLAGRPSLTVGDHRFIHLNGAAVLVERRIGRGERWAFGLSDIHRLDDMPCWWPREAREWARRAEVLNLVTHARAMAAHTL